MPKYRLFNGVLRNLVTLVIVDGMDMLSSARVRLVSDFIRKIKASPTPSFNAIRVWIAPQEIERSPLFKLCEVADIALVADTVNNVYVKTPDAYPAYIKSLYDHGVRIFCVDDAHRFKQSDIEGMAAPFEELENATLLLSSGAGKEARMPVARAALTFQKPLEVQCYVSNDETAFVDKWTTEDGMAVCAVGVYGRVLPLPATIDKIFANIAEDIPNITLYAGFDDTTDLRRKTASAHWTAILRGLAKFWARTS